MIVKYRHVDDPDVTKTFDTVIALKKHPKSFTGKYWTQEEYDEFTLRNFERDVQNGIVLEYEKVS